LFVNYQGISLGGENFDSNSNLIREALERFFDS